MREFIRNEEIDGREGASTSGEMRCYFMTSLCSDK